MRYKRLLEIAEIVETYRDPEDTVRNAGPAGYAR